MVNKECCPKRETIDHNQQISHYLNLCGKASICFLCTQSYVFLCSTQQAIRSTMFQFQFFVSIMQLSNQEDIYKRQYILIQYLCKSHKKAKKRYMCLLRSQDILTPEGECGRWQDTDASPARENVLLLYWQQKSIFGQFFSSLYCIRLKLPYFGDYIILGGWHTEQLCGNLPLQSTKPVD